MENAAPSEKSADTPRPRSRARASGANTKRDVQLRRSRPRLLPLTPPGTDCDRSGPRTKQGQGRWFGHALLPRISSGRSEKKLHRHEGRDRDASANLHTSPPLVRIHRIRASRARVRVGWASQYLHQGWIGERIRNLPLLVFSLTPKCKDGRQARIEAQ